MRMRKKPNLATRMEKAGAVWIKEPEGYKGKWRESFPEYTFFHLELGCGKGRFTADTAGLHPDTFIAAVERVPDAMVVGMERCAQRGIKNVRFIDCDVKRLADIAEPGEFDLIYINFCDPWPKSRDAKHRLTAPNFLRGYAGLLPIGGKVCFKTDNLALFRWSLSQLEEEGWSLSEVTNDLHANGVCGVMTDYEEKFHREGIRINRLVAERTENTKTLSSGEAPRLRNSSLVDARGYAESVRKNSEAEK